MPPRIDAVLTDAAWPDAALVDRLDGIVVDAALIDPTQFDSVYTDLGRLV